MSFCGFLLTLVFLDRVVVYVISAWTWSKLDVRYLLLSYISTTRDVLATGEPSSFTELLKSSTVRLALSALSG